MSKPTMIKSNMLLYKQKIDSQEPGDSKLLGEITKVSLLTRMNAIRQSGKKYKYQLIRYGINTTPVLINNLSHYHGICGMTNLCDIATLF